MTRPDIQSTQLTSAESAFLAGRVYTEAETPWRDDPAFVLLFQYPGLRDSVGGRVADALTQAIGLVQAITQVDLKAVAQQRRPATGLSLGFGMNLLEPYDLLRTFALDCVHAYEWMSEQVLDAARTYAALQSQAPALLPTHLRLHHGTISDLSALADQSVRVVYVANVFNREIPMTAATFDRALREILRVLTNGGIVLSRGSADALETELAPHGRFLLHIPLIAVFQKGDGDGA
jgi:Methyltransferase domain